MQLPDWPFWLALTVMLVGLAGVVLPGLPGVGLIWIAALVYAIAERFATIDPLTFVALTLLAAAGIGADLALTQAGSRLAGASWRALLAGMVLGAVGFVLGWLVGGIGALPGAMIGTLAGIVIVEYRHRRDWREALKAGGGWLAGCAVSRFVQLIVSLAMIALFIWQAALRG